MHSQMQGGQWPLPERKGVVLMMSIADALTLMIAFASLIVAVIAVSKDKK
ncbi:hypothetical protein TGS27_1586 [Geobacillus stearothermophilus]|nr:hypothetical protein TGS27_1586 [Geobacillus stearothermophilus]